MKVKEALGFPGLRLGVEVRVCAVRLEDLVVQGCFRLLGFQDFRVVVV